ncbi:UDP-N-acetylglucosamine:alpha-6-D-mannoside beta-1,2-N-acetylglucosaminyltransferase II, partial [Operophtera brumata]
MFRGLVLFLEEDHYVAEDFLHMLSLLRSTADRSCAQCEILSLGTYLKTYQYHVNGDKAANEERRKRKDYQSWNFQVYPNLYARTQKLQHEFCAYDDYNWDYSLLHLSQNRPGRDKFKVVMCKGPR